MANTFKFTWYGTEYKISFRKGQYSNNKTLALQAMCYDEEMQGEVPFGMLTINLYNPPKEENCAYVGDNNVGNLVDVLVEAGLAEQLPNFQWSGFCMYPCYKFDKQWLDTLPAIF